jgi:hypothetical protein
MRLLTLLTALACMVLLSAVASAESAISSNDENSPDTLYVGQIQTVKGDKVAVKVDFVNDQELAALTIPLGLVGDLYQIDSVSFVGSRVEYLKMKPVTIAENREDVVFGAICMTEDYIAPGRGLLATLYLSPIASSKSDFCVIDTITMGPASVLFTKISSASFIPEFQAGRITYGQAESDSGAAKKEAEGETSGKKDGE